MGELFLLCLFSTVKIDTEKLVVCEDDSLDEDELNVRCSPNTSFSPVIFLHLCSHCWLGRGLEYIIIHVELGVGDSVMTSSFYM